MSLQRQIKSCLKQLVYQNSFLVGSLSKFYQISGSKPWSLGYSFYKFNYIEHSLRNNLRAFKNKKLPNNYGNGLDERAVEYPWFVAELEESAKLLLDAGSALNHYKVLKFLKDHRLFISTLDFEDINTVDSMPSYIYEDLRNTAYKNNFFDAIACISTLEHVGMDNSFYTSDKTKNETDYDAYLEVIDEFKRILKEAGKVFITVPYGHYKNHKHFQIFNDEMVNQLIVRFAPSTFSIDYFLYENNQWQFSNKSECEKYSESYTNPEEINILAAARSIVALKLIK